VKDINKALLGWGCKLLGPWFITQCENRLKAQYCKQGHEMQSQFNAKKCHFLYMLVYLVWKRGKLVPNRRLFKSNLRVWKRQVHSAIFSIFDSESEKSLTRTHDLSNPILTTVKGTNHSTIFSIFGRVRKELNWARLEDSRRQATGEAKAPVRTFCGMSVSWEEPTQAREDPKLSKSRRTNCYQRLSSPWYIG